MVMADSEVGICLEGVDGDEEFDMNNPHFWDHPEHVSIDELVKDWNSNNVDCFDPIPMADILIETPTTNCCKIDNFVSNFHIHIDDMPIVTPTMNCRKMDVYTPKFQVHSDGIYEPKQLLNSVGFSSGEFNVEDSSTTSVINQNKFSEIQESGVFQTRSPVSMLESSGSCSTGNSRTIPGQPGSTQSPISVLESSGACSSGNSRTIPGQARSKIIRKPSHVKAWYVISPWFATKSASERKSNARKNKERRKKLSPLSVTAKTMKDISQNDLMLRSVVTKKCTHCEITKTPQWREGPMGPKTLCNACGVRYRSGRLFPEYRPAASPTFAPALHSNSHKKVVEMRNKAESHAPTFEEPLIPLGELILQVTVS